MTVAEARMNAKANLIDIAQKQGYLSTNDIVKFAESSGLGIDEFDRLFDSLILEGIIIRDDNESDARHKKNDSPNYDKAKLDYNKIYNKVIKIDSSLEWYIDKLRAIEPPRVGEEAMLIHHAKEGNRYAKERLITMFLRVALRIALWHHEKYKLPLDETIQDANVGLLLALEKFPIDKNFRFSTYAPWWIRQYIMRQTQGLSKVFYTIPAHLKEKLIGIIKIKKIHDCPFCLSFSFCPYLLELISQQLNCDKQTAILYLSMLQDPFSIEELVENDDCNLSDFSEGEWELFEIIYQNELSEHFKKILSKIKERNRTILEYRFGLADGRTKTLEEVGEIFGLTRERIRQIEAKTLQTLKGSISSYLSYC